MSWTYLLNQWVWGSLDWLFPPDCGGCNRAGYRWCPDCQQQVSRIPEPMCDTCGLPVSKPGLCPACTVSKPPYRALRSWLVFEGPIRNALHKLKYRQNIALGDALGNHLVGFLRTLDWPVEIVVPIPLGKTRLKERGYNQVGLVAKPMAALIGLRYSHRSIFRMRDTRSQVGLSILERKENMVDAFRADPELVAGKIVLIVDDVATTGATLASCAQALLLADAQGVYALTIARALPHHGLQVV